MKPILFNTEMVRAILAGRKSVTRRVVKQCHIDKFVIAQDGKLLGSFDGYEPYPTVDDCLYQPDDILYVRETWCENGNYELYPFETEQFWYKADRQDRDLPTPEWFRGWRPSIHMPREAARLFLRVTQVEVQQIKDITDSEAISEGFTSRTEFISTFLKIYPDCTEDGWCWVIRFEKIGNPPL